MPDPLRLDRYKGRPPGVHLEWTARERNPDSSLRPLRTDIAGFVGLAESGPVDNPLPVESADEFRTHYGRPVPGGFLAAAVRGFFANGGRRAWIVRVAGPNVRPAFGRTWLDDDTVIEVTAASPGAWANGLRVSFGPARPNSVRIRVETPDGGLADERILLPEGFARANVLAGGGVPELTTSLIRVTPRFTPPSGALAAPRDVLGTLRKVLESKHGWTTVELGKDEWAKGADDLEELTARDLLGTENSSEPGRGLDLLDQVDEVSLVAIPDLHATASASTTAPTRFGADAILQAQSALVGRCRGLGDRVALLDPPREIASFVPLHDMGHRSLVEWADAVGGSFAAAYWPWLLVPPPSGSGDALPVPPSGHVAGLIARTDTAYGVYRAPANLPLQDVADLVERVDDEDAGFLNEAGVNVIRVVPGHGIRPMGARTLARPEDFAWRYLNVRRLVSMIGEALAREAGWTVFEPQGPTLWRAIERTARALLDRLWRQRALGGASPDDAFDVRCDATTNPPQEQDQGRVVCVLRLLPSLPAEQVVIRISLDAAGFAAEAVPDAVAAGGFNG